MIKITSPNCRQKKGEKTGEITVPAEITSYHSHNVPEQRKSTQDYDDIIEIPDTDEWLSFLDSPHNTEQPDAAVKRIFILEIFIFTLDEEKRRYHIYTHTHKLHFRIHLFHGFFMVMEAWSPKSQVS